MRNDRSSDRHSIEDLRRQARRLRIEANRAAPPLARQFLALAALYEERAERMERRAA